MRILVVEDEARLATLIRRGLGEAGYTVDLLDNGTDALRQGTSSLYELIILDVMLPGTSGIDVCRHMRNMHDHTPVLLLTARDAIEDRVLGLDAGADDYLTKPFAMSELAARLRALGRRPRRSLDVVLELGDLRVDSRSHQVWKGDREVQLPNKEYRILDYLLRNPNRVVTRDMIANHVWDYEFLNSTNVIDVHIRSLRKLLDDPYPNSLIQTVRGVGYRILTTPK